MIFLPRMEKKLGISRFRWPFQNRWRRRDSCVCVCVCWCAYVFPYIYLCIYATKVSPISRPEKNLEFWSAFPITLVIDENYLRAMFSKIVQSSEKFWQYTAAERHRMTRACALYICISHCVQYRWYYNGTKYYLDILSNQLFKKEKNVKKSTFQVLMNDFYFNWIDMSGYNRN